MTVTITVTSVRAQVSDEIHKEENVETTNVDVDLHSLTYNELRNIAKDNGINASGTKNELIARIKGE